MSLVQISPMYVMRERGSRWVVCLFCSRVLSLHNCATKAIKKGGSFTTIQPHCTIHLTLHVIININSPYNLTLPQVLLCTPTPYTSLYFTNYTSLNLIMLHHIIQQNILHLTISHTQHNTTPHCISYSIIIYLSIAHYYHHHHHTSHHTLYNIQYSIYTSLSASGDRRKYATPPFPSITPPPATTRPANQPTNQPQHKNQQHTS